MRILCGWHRGSLAVIHNPSAPRPDINLPVNEALLHRSRASTRTLGVYADPCGSAAIARSRLGDMLVILEEREQDRIIRAADETISRARPGDHTSYPSASITGANIGITGAK
jgi:hypothetical protein